MNLLAQLKGLVGGASPSPSLLHVLSAPDQPVKNKAQGVQGPQVTLQAPMGAYGATPNPQLVGPMEDSLQPQAAPNTLNQYTTRYNISTLATRPTYGLVVKPHLDHIAPMDVQPLTRY